MNARRNGGRIAASDRSALPGLRGIPSWTAVMLLIACTLTGIAWDISTGSGADRELGTGFTIGFAAGSILAALLVARRGVFVAAVQPPIVMTVLVPAFSVLGSAGLSLEGMFNRSQIVSIALPLASRFPLMVIITLAVIAIVLVRAFLLEPKAKEPAPERRRAASQRR